MRSFFSNPVIEWLVLVFAMMAGFVVVKLLLSYFPDGGMLGAIKSVGQVA
jgi:hypothetical protein